MKITCYPTKESVTKLLSFQLEGIQKKLDEAKASLTRQEAEKAESRIHNPYQDNELMATIAHVRSLEDEEGSIQDKLAMVETSEGGVLQADFDA